MVMKTNTILQNKNKDLENEVREIKFLLEESHHAYNNLKAKFERVESNYKLICGKEQNYQARLQQCERKITWLKKIKKDVPYFELYDSLLSEIKELFDCPLSMVDLTKPCILPSGNTIQEECWDELKKRNSYDPYNKEIRLNLKIINRFALEVRNIIDNSYRKIDYEDDRRKAAERAKLEAQQNSKSIDIQVNLEVRSENDIAQIYYLDELCTSLRKEIKNLQIENMKLEKVKESHRKTIKYLEQDLKDSNSLHSSSTQEFVLSMLNQSRGTNYYNSVSLKGYFIFASLRNRFAMGICYTIREITKLYQQKLDEDRILKEKEEKEFLIYKESLSEQKEKKGTFEKLYNWMYGIKTKEEIMEEERAIYYKKHF